VPPTTEAPNDLWTADFKGEFRTGNMSYCYPLTIADQHTRFLLICHGLLSTQTVTARPVFKRVFREYGGAEEGKRRVNTCKHATTSTSKSAPTSQARGLLASANASRGLEPWSTILRAGEEQPDSKHLPAVPLNASS
jgi:transposase InsO family protein